MLQLVFIGSYFETDKYAGSGSVSKAKRYQIIKSNDTISHICVTTHTAIVHFLYNFITISGYLAGKREWVHFGPNPWDWDRNEICGQIFSGSRTEHTCSVRLVDFEVEVIEEK